MWIKTLQLDQHVGKREGLWCNHGFARLARAGVISSI
jgi:hypothetical protein